MELAWGLGYYTLLGEVCSEPQAYIFFIFLFLTLLHLSKKMALWRIFSILPSCFCMNKPTQTALLFFSKAELFSYFCFQWVLWCLSSSETIQSVWITSELMKKVKLVLNMSFLDHLLRKYICKNCFKTFSQGRFGF